MAYETIKLTKYSDVIVEYDAGGTITPGMLLELEADGDVVAHNTAGANVVPIMFALENTLEGKGIDDDYASGAKVQCWIPGRGDIVYCLLHDDVDITLGDIMESDGEGRVQEHAADPGDSTTGSVQQAIIGIALETVSSGLGSGSESSAGGLYYNPRVKIRII